MLLLSHVLKRTEKILIEQLEAHGDKCILAKFLTLLDTRTIKLMATNAVQDNEEFERTIKRLISKHKNEIDEIMFSPNEEIEAGEVYGDALEQKQLIFKLLSQTLAKTMLQSISKPLTYKKDQDNDQWTLF